MGSMIHLAVGRLEIDWGKNLGYTDHSALFQTSDVANVPYYYAEDDPDTEEGWKVLTVYKEGYSKPLREVIDRVNLLGHTLAHTEEEFNYLSNLNDFDRNKFSFAQLQEALATVDVTTLTPDYGEGEDFGKFFQRQLFPRLGLEPLVEDPHYVQFAASQGMENLSAYSILQLLAANPSAATLPVTWAFADLAENGWAPRSEFVKPLEASNQFLIVTEGSSDALIIRHAFSLLKPHISDFFRFVDMQEGYPFSGTGNLVNFFKGLISIGVQNNVLVLFDNDAEGVASYQRCAALNIPDNMRVLTLPSLSRFEQFRTIGPNGAFLADINGQAASIECYLDLPLDAQIRWTNYNQSVRAYHGALEGKDEYKRAFLDQREMKEGYDYSKIEAVLDLLIRHCMEIKEAQVSRELARFSKE